MEKYKFIEHTADMKFQAFGKGLCESFKNASYALREIITKDKIKPVIKKIIQVKGKDFESLLYNFLEEFLFLIDSDNLVMANFECVKIEEVKKEWKLFSVVYFDNIKKYKTITDIKAITYNDMFIKFDKPNKKWILQVVVDV